MILLICGLLLFLFYWFFTFKVNVRLRKKTSTFDQLKDTKGKIYRDRDGVDKLVYRLGLFKRQAMPLPPPDAISLDMKGKKCVEIEASEDGGLRYIIKDTTTHKFKPYDTNDRTFHINEHDKRLERKSKKTWMQIVADAVPFIALIVILALVIFGWGEIVAPFERVGAQTGAIAAEQKEITIMLKEIIKQEQVIRGEEAPVKRAPAPKPPVDTPPPE